MSVPAASSAFCVVVSRHVLRVRIIATHVFGISHVCDLSKQLDSELRWCRGVVVVVVEVGGRIVWCAAGAIQLSEPGGRTWHGLCVNHSLLHHDLWHCNMKIDVFSWNYQT